MEVRGFVRRKPLSSLAKLGNFKAVLVKRQIDHFETWRVRSPEWLPKKCLHTELAAAKCSNESVGQSEEQGRFPGGSDSKGSACIAGDLGLIPGLGRSPEGGHGNPLQNSCLENPHEQRNLVGCSSWAHKESDSSEVT